MVDSLEEDIVVLGDIRDLLVIQVRKDPDMLDQADMLALLDILDQLVLDIRVQQDMLDLEGLLDIQDQSDMLDHKVFLVLMLR